MSDVVPWYQAKQEQHRQEQLSKKRPPKWRRVGRLIHESARYIDGELVVTGGTYNIGRNAAKRARRAAR